MRSNAVAVLLAVIVLVVGLLALRYRPALTGGEARSAIAASAQRAAEPAYPPASIDGRPEPDRSGVTVELCGYGPFEVAPGRLHPPHLAASAELALAQAIAAMAEGSDPRQRAAARYLQAAAASMRTREGYVAQHADCEASRECRARANDAAWQSFVLAREPLIADALATRDSSAYALAYYACARRPQGAEAGGSCRLVSAAQWAQLDSNNLVAWAHAAREAQDRGDAAGRAEALRRAAQATESHWRADTILEPLGHSNVRNLDSATRSIAQLNAMGVRSAVPVPGIGLLREECADKAPMDDARRELCSTLGRTLADRGTTVMELSLGAAIGERAGWPDDEVRALRERRDAFQQALRGDPAPWTCGYQQQLDQYTVAALDGSGELQFARKLVEASGRSSAELARQWRTRTTRQPK